MGEDINGRGWCIDPIEEPFNYKGACAVNHAGNASGCRAYPGSYASANDEKYNFQKNPDNGKAQIFEFKVD